MADDTKAMAAGFDSSAVVIFLILIFLLFSDSAAFARHFDMMSSALSHVKNLTETINATVQALQVAAETPKALKQRKKDVTA